MGKFCGDFSTDETIWALQRHKINENEETPNMKLLNAILGKGDSFADAQKELKESISSMARAKTDTLKEGLLKESGIRFAQKGRLAKVKARLGKKGPSLVSQNDPVEQSKTDAMNSLCVKANINPGS